MYFPVLVIGGGITGIQASLDIANAGFKVILVEKAPSIGGHMLQFLEVFPTLDCPQCIGTPKMAEVGLHPNIELMTYSEVESVSGSAGKFKVKIKRKPRYVDVEKCTGCGECAKVCPVYLANDWDVGLSQRKAAYMLFPQAVPFKYIIDRRIEGCFECYECEAACDAGAIDHGDKEKYEEREVMTIVVATGYDVFDAKLKPEYGYGVYSNVITGLELERLAEAGGPTGGKIQVNGKEPRNVVFIQCVGSRDKSVDVEYCSRVCCMYTAKQAWYIKSKIPEAKVTICYIDVRSFGKGYEEFYERVQKQGAIYRRGAVAEVYQRDDKLIVKAEDTLLGEIYEEEADLVVLAVGLRPGKDMIDMAKKLNIPIDADGFFLEANPKIGAVESGVEGIYLAGCCQGPKDIADSVAQASAAAMACIIASKAGKESGKS